MRLVAVLGVVVWSVVIAACADGGSEPEPCRAGEHVQAGACVACAPGSTNAAGDDPAGADTSCEAMLCTADQHVASNACVACAPGSTNAAGDNATSADTACDPTVCTTDQRVMNHACAACGPGSTNAAGDDASGANTTCDATLCMANQHVTGHACVACGPGSTNAPNDDASGADTACDATRCPADQHVAGHACVACAPGTTNAANDDASGADTACDVILCAVNQRVQANACVPCPPGESNPSGDDASGGNTTCETFAVLRLSEVAPNQTGSRDLVELLVTTSGTLRGISIADDGGALAMLPDLVVAAGDLVIVHLNPAAGVTGELTTKGDCADAACYAGAWDVNGGAAGIAFTRRVLSVVDPYNDNQDAVAFTNLGTTPAAYAMALQGVQTAGDWLPATCGGSACTDATTPSANDVSVDWTGVGTGPTSASVQRRSTADTNTKSDWGVVAGTVGVANPGPCQADERVASNTCVACPAGQSNLAGDDPAGADTACDVAAILRLTEVAPNQTGSRDLVELVVITAGTLRGITIAQDGTALATLPDLAVSAGAVVVVHLNPAAGVTSELTTQADCTDAACYPAAWDVTGGATGIAYTRRVLSVIAPGADVQDVAAFSNLSTSPAAYATELQAVQTSGDWLPASCGGVACTDATTPSANDVSIDWTGCGTTPAAASVQRTSSADTDAKADWIVTAPTLGTAP